MPLPKLQSPTSFVRNVRRYLKGIFSFSFNVSLLLICNVLQCISALLLPFSRQAVRTINRWIGGFWWATCDLFAEKLWKIDIVISGDQLPMRENVMLTANHQEMSDITTLFRLARYQGRIGDLKWFVKDIIKYVPGVGWGMVFLDCIFLKRNWSDDKERLYKQLSRFEKEQIPIWALSFVEGTRLRPHKLKAAQEYANKVAVRPHQHLLLPRTKGFCLTLVALRNHLDAVYDATIGYVGGVPNLWQWCCGDVKKVSLYVRRFPMNELPIEEEALAQWLKDRWYEKDDLLDHYYHKGEWPSSLREQ